MPQMPRNRLIHLFSRPLLRGLDILAELQSAQMANRAPAVTAQDATDELCRLLGEQMAEGRRRRAEDGEISPARQEELESAQYAVVAYLDDRFRQQSNWHGRDSEPLQYALYRERGAGDELFSRIRQMKEQQAELKETYSLILGLGFRGRAFSQDDQALQMLEEQKVRLRVGLRPEPVGARQFEAADAWLTPQPYGVEAPPPAVLPTPSRWPLFAAIAAGVALLLMVGGGALWWWSRGPDGVQVANAALSDLACSSVQTAPVQGQRSAVQVSGRFADRAELDARLDRIRDAGVEVREGTLVERPRPICDVLDLLDRRRVDAGAGAPSLDPGGTRGGYQIGEFFVAHASSRNAGHLTVFFLRPLPGGGAQFVPLQPTQRQPNSAAEAGARVRLGRPGQEINQRDRGLIVTGPAGPAAIFAISTATPLLDATNLPRTGDTEGMLRALEAGLARQPIRPDGQINAAATHAMIAVTEARDALPRVQTALRNLQCSSIQAFAEPGGRIRLTGRYADAALIEDRLAPFSGQIDRQTLVHVPAPWCEVVGEIESVAAPERPADRPAMAGPTLDLTRRDGRFAVGDPFQLDATMSTGFAGHLTVLYLHPVRGFMPLMPSSAHPARELPAGERVRLDLNAQGFPIWQVSEPPGFAMILAFATTTPLIPNLQAFPTERAAGLAALRQAIQRQSSGPGGTPYTYAMITVLPPGTPPGRN